MAGFDLAIDTAGSYCSIAIRRYCDVGAEGAEPPALIVRTSDGDGNHFERLPEIVRDACNAAERSVKELRRIVVGTGPGSFTGIRIGMSFAKGLAWANRAPLTGCCSFSGCASAALDSCGEGASVAVIADARREEVFIASYERVNDQLRVLTEPTIVGMAVALERARGVSCVVTPQKGFTLCHEKGQQSISVVEVASTALGLIRALPVIVDTRIGGESRLPFAVVELQKVLPTYVREVSAKTIAQRRSDGVGS